MFIERQKKCLKYLVIEPGARKNLTVVKLLTIWIPFNVFSGTIPNNYKAITTEIILLQSIKVYFKETLGRCYE